MSIIAKGEGKKFEEAFTKSVPDYVLVKRLNDNASSWSGGANTRFASKNECDYILFNDHTMTFYGLELKSTKHNSLTFWRKDFAEDGKKSFQIRKCQIQGLEKWSKHIGVFGLIINFRGSENETYFVDIKEFLRHTSPPFSKKSINKNDILGMNPIKIDSELKRTNYRYDIQKFLEETRIGV